MNLILRKTLKIILLLENLLEFVRLRFDLSPLSNDSRFTTLKNAPNTLEHDLHAFKKFVSIIPTPIILCYDKFFTKARTKVKNYKGA